MSSAAGQREHRQAFIDAQRLYSAYAIWFNQVHQTLTIVTIVLTAITTLAPILSDTLDLSPNSSESHAFRIVSILTGSAATSVIGFLQGARFYELATKCERLSLMINVYLSGMVTDEYELSRLRNQILTAVRTTQLLWVPIPLLTVEYYQGQPASTADADPGGSADIPPLILKAPPSKTNMDRNTHHLPL